MWGILKDGNLWLAYSKHSRVARFLNEWDILWKSLKKNTYPQVAWDDLLYQIHHQNELIVFLLACSDSDKINYFILDFFIALERVLSQEST